MGETYDEVKANKIIACKALLKMKELEKSNNMHTIRINKNTIVCCNNKERLEDYKKL